MGLLFRLLSFVYTMSLLFVLLCVFCLICFAWSFVCFCLFVVFNLLTYFGFIDLVCLTLGCDFCGFGCFLVTSGCLGFFDIRLLH